jgi:hypothetical protein
MFSPQSLKGNINLKDLKPIFEVHLQLLPMFNSLIALLQRKQIIEQYDEEVSNLVNA